MRKILYVLFCIGLLFAGDTNAQCTGGRFVDTTTFPTYTKSTVTYSTVYNQKMDIYQPTGDTMAHRPLVILAHGGAFYQGNKSNDITIVNLCKSLVKRGYVTVSIDYRLTTILNMFDSAAAITEVIQALSDGKAAVRYFVLDARGSDTYKIDTNLIFAGGNSAGAVLFMHLGYISSISECPNYIQDAMNLNGGFEGDSGNPIPGYTTSIKAVINLAGALNKSSFVGMNDCPSVNAQGDEDKTVPFMCAHALDTLCPVTLCGMGVLEGVYATNQVFNYTKVYQGAGHVPWSGDQTMYNQVDSMVTKFLAEGFVCNNLAVPGVKHRATELSLFPNPAKEVLNFQSSEAISGLAVYDAMGRLVQEYTGLNALNYHVSTANIPAGIYFVKARFVRSDDYVPVVRQIVVE